MAVDEYVQARPAPGLRPYVGWYSGYRQRGIAPGTHRGLPSPYLTLILTLDEPLVIAAHPDGRQAPGRYDTLIGGLHLRPALIEHDGNQSGVQLAVHPLGCRALFGLPAAELAGLDVDVAALLGDRATERLRAALHAEKSWSARFAALDAALLSRLDQDHEPQPLLGYAHRRVLATGGRIPVAALAEEVGWSARHLTQRFRAATGLGVKETARVARFDRARRRLLPGVRLSDLAADLGFFDQAHLAREFQALAGVPARQWLAEEIGFVQAAAAANADDEWHD